jgi:hypothetical protein
MKSRYLLSIICALLWLSGCGYQSIIKEEHRTIAIPIFDNKTIYPGYEFEFSKLLNQKILTQSPFLIKSSKENPNFLLTGEITDYTRPTLIEGKTDQVVISQLAMTLNISLIDLNTHKSVFEGNHTENAELIGPRGETEESARAEVFDKLTRWVVNTLTTKTLNNNDTTTRQ